LKTILNKPCSFRQKTALGAFLLHFPLEKTRTAKGKNVESPHFTVSQVPGKIGQHIIAANMHHYLLWGRKTYNEL
jgi:hypothetical protein